MSTSQFRTFGAEKIAAATANQDVVAGPITLYEAMARALKYNLDARVEIMESAMRVRQLDLAHYSMLPDLVASAGYSGRTHSDDTDTATRDPAITTSDLSFSWNILDFGLSYVRAKQAADDVLVQEEAKRKIVNRVIEDVRTAYWRAASYEQLVGRMRSLEAQVATALRESRQLSTSGDSSPLMALTYERQLIEVKREIETLESDLIVAKSQLSALMNVPPGTKFKLRPPKRSVLKLNLPGKPAELFEIAVTNRPEMREVAYEMRINDEEVNAALLSLLPSFNLSAGANYNSNTFIAANDWVGWGAQVSWNLLKFTSIGANKKAINAQGEAINARALSVAMAVMAQVHISRLRYGQNSEAYGTASELSAVSHRILDQVRAEVEADRATQQTLIREEMNSLLADAKRDIIYASLQNSYANIYASIGLDPFPAGLNTDASVKEVAAALEQMWEQRKTNPMAAAAAPQPIATAPKAVAATAALKLRSGIGVKP